MSGSLKSDVAMSPQIEALLSARRPWLLIRAQQLCRTRADAEDLVQEAFMRFLAAFGQVSPLPSENVCASWLVSTITNCFYDQLRRQRTREKGSVDPTLVQAEEAEPAARSVYDRISDEQFNSAIQSLSPRVRTAIEMHAQGRKYHEIADELGIPMGTVAKRLHLARAKLRNLLEPILRGGDN